MTGRGAADRSVHASHSDGTEVVRYDRAGKWYIERASDPRIAVGLRRAVREALRSGMSVYLGLPGGTMFDSKIRTERQSGGSGD